MRWPLFVIGSFFVVGLSARAEEGTAKSVDAPAPKAEAHAPVENVPDAEKGGYAQNVIARMREALAKILGYLETARKEKDVVKLNCVNEKLTAVKGLLRISEQADVAMQEALARRDAESAGHEFEKIAVARGKVDQLVTESESCVGELAVYSGDTQVDVEIEPGTVTTDTTKNVGGTVVQQRPPPSSPYY